MVKAEGYLGRGKGFERPPVSEEIVEKVREAFLRSHRIYKISKTRSPDCLWNRLQNTQTFEFLSLLFM